MTKTICLSLASVFAGLGLAAGAESTRKSEASQIAVTPPPAASKPGAASTAPDAEGWTSLFDGKTLKGWKDADFYGRGSVIVTNGEILLKKGYMTGIVWTNADAVLRMNYEISLEARRVEGDDFFCGLTFPVGKDPCSLIVGGWGGSLVGLSCLDGEDAANNDTSTSMEFKQNQWYHIRMRVTPKKLQAWIDGEKLVDAGIEDRRISIRFEVESCVPLGVATWSTGSALRNIKMRSLDEGEK